MLKAFRKVFVGNDLERVHDLTLEDEVGSGTYSKVYRGSWRKTKTTKLKVAIKVVDEQTASPDFITNFLPREIEISKKLEHKNLLTTMLYFSHRDKTYIVTELARFDLLQYLRLKGTQHISFLQLDVFLTKIGLYKLDYGSTRPPTELILSSFRS